MRIGGTSSGYANVYFPDDVDITQDGHFAIFGEMVPFPRQLRYPIYRPAN